jgi:hypothetical protein
MPDEEDEVQNLFLAARTELRVAAYAELKELKLQSHEVTLEIAERELKSAEKKGAIKYWQPPELERKSTQQQQQQGSGRQNGGGKPKMAPVGVSREERALAAYTKSKGLQRKDVRVEDLKATGGVEHWSKAQPGPARAGERTRGSGEKCPDADGKQIELPTPKQFNMQVQEAHHGWKNRGGPQRGAGAH